MSKKKLFFANLRHSWAYRAWDKLLFLLLLMILIVLLPGHSVYSLVVSKQDARILPLPFAVPTPAPYPVNTTGLYPGAEITAQGIVILDMDSGVFMFTRNELTPMSPASTTKIMTALVALEHYQLDDVVTVQTAANDGQVMGLVPGERISVENLLYGALIQSGNDAAWSLAEHFPGGIETFVTAMNEKAASLSLAHSHFTNPVGYYDPSHTMTPQDLARLSAYALSDKTIAKIVAIPQITISDVTHTYFHPLSNVNQLLGKIPGVGGIKTGWTEESGENLVTLIERDGHRVVIVVLKSTDRFGETAELINWIYGNFTWQSFISERNLQ